MFASNKEELKKRLDEHYHRELELLEEVFSLSENDMSEVYEFIINNRWLKAIKEIKEYGKRAD